MSVVEFFREHPATDEAGKTFTQAWERDGKKESTFLAFVRKVMDAGSRGCSELAPRSENLAEIIPLRNRFGLLYNLEAVYLGAGVLTIIRALGKQEIDLQFFSEEVRDLLENTSLKIKSDEANDGIFGIGNDEYGQMFKAAQDDYTLATFFKNNGEKMPIILRNYLNNVRVVYGGDTSVSVDMLARINQDMIEDYETRARFLVRPSS